MACSASKARSNADCEGAEILGEFAGQAHQVDAEAGVDGLAVQEALAKQPLDRARLVERPARRDAQAPRVAVDAKQGQLQPPRALAVPLQHHHEIVGEPVQRRLDRLGVQDRAGETPFGEEFGGREARRDRGPRGAVQFVEPGDEIGAEARGDGRARAHREIADALEPRAGEVGGEIGRDPQSRDRHVVEDFRQRLAFETRRDERLAPEPRQRGGRARRVREARPSA